MFHFISGLVILAIAGYSLATMPLGWFNTKLILWDVSNLEYRGKQIWLVDVKDEGRSTSYGVSTQGAGQETEFWVKPDRISGQLNFFESWQDHLKLGEEARKGVMFEGVIWVITVLFFGMILSYSELDTYIIATTISGLVAAIGLFGLLGDKLPYSTAIISFIPLAGWGLVMPTVAMILDRRNRINLTFNEITIGMVNQIVACATGFTFLFIVNKFYPITQLLPW
jgi:hypothetical protein